MKQMTDVDSFLSRAELLLQPKEMRKLAASLLRLADDIDRGWSDEKNGLSYFSMSKAGRIERNAFELAKVAHLEARKAKLRERYLEQDLLGEPAWNIPFELFQQFAGGVKVSTKSLQLIAGCPETTALRVIDRLEDAGLVERSASESDKRVTLIALTRLGVVKVGSTLQELNR